MMTDDFCTEAESTERFLRHVFSVDEQEFRRLCEKHEQEIRLTCENIKQSRFLNDPALSEALKREMLLLAEALPGLLDLLQQPHGLAVFAQTAKSRADDLQNAFESFKKIVFMREAIEKK